MLNMKFLTIIFLSCLSVFGATQTFYVVTGYGASANTAGGDGSTTNITGSNRAFASLREAITSNNLDVSAIRRIDCRGNLPDTLSVIQAHWDSIDTTPTTYLEIFGDTPHPWMLDTNYYWRSSAATSSFYNNKPGHIRMHHMVVTISGGDGNTHGYRLATQNVGAGRSDCDIRLYDSYFLATGGGTPNACYNSQFSGPLSDGNGTSPGAGTCRIWNFISDGGFMGSVNTGIENYNVTVYNAGFVDAQIIKNCIVAGYSGTDYNSVGTGGGASDYNVDDDGSAPGANSVTGSPTFVDEANGDFHLASNDTVAKDTGTDDPSSGVFSTDIDGQTRVSPWDRGADEIPVTILQSTNQYSWGTYSGIPGGIPFRSTIAATHNPGDTAGQIESSISSASSNRVIKLNAGTYSIGEIDFGSAVGVTLRGSTNSQGQPTTIINSSGGRAISSNPNGLTYSSTASLSSGYTQGSTSIVFSTTPNVSIVAGNMIQIGAHDISGIVFSTSASLGEHRYSTHTVLSKSVNTVTFTPPLPTTYYSSDNPWARYLSSGPGAVMCGIEDIKIIASGSSDNTIDCWGVDGFWLYNIEITNTVNAACYFYGSKNVEIRHSYIHHANGFPANLDGYGVYFYEGTSFSKAEDNIFEKMFVAFWQTGGCAGNAFLYNFATNSSAQNFAHQEGIFRSNHGACPMYDLFEGNVGEQFQTDGYHGNDIVATIYRNYIHGMHASNSDNRKMIDLQRGSYYFYVIGNILGHSSWVADEYEMSGQPDYASGNVIYRLGYPNTANNGTNADDDDPEWPLYTKSYPDTNVLFTLTRHANYDYKNGAVSYVTGADTNISNSLYYSSKPDYFGNCPWPPFEPTNPSLANQTNIPAGFRFVTGMDSGGGESGSGQSHKVIRMNAKNIRIGTLQKGN